MYLHFVYIVSKTVKGMQLFLVNVKNNTVNKY